MRTTLGDQIREVLRAHRGEANFISAGDLARQCGLRGDGARVVRDTIATEAALWGDVIVAGIPGLGYFAVADFDEALNYADCLLGLFTTGFDKFEAFLDLCERHGLRIVLGEDRQTQLVRIHTAIGRVLDKYGEGLAG